MCVSIGPHSDSSTHTHRIVFLSMGSSEINLFNAAADAPGIPISIGIRTADNRKRTADSGLWLVAPTRTPPQQEEWRRGKVLSEEKSSKVKSSQVKSAAATYST